MILTSHLATVKVTDIMIHCHNMSLMSFYNPLAGHNENDENAAVDPVYGTQNIQAQVLLDATEMAIWRSRAQHLYAVSHDGLTQGKETQKRKRKPKRQMPVACGALNPFLLQDRWNSSMKRDINIESLASLISRKTPW